MHIEATVSSDPSGTSGGSVRRHVVVLAPLPVELDAVVAAFGLDAGAGDDGRWSGRCGGSAVTAFRAGMGPAAARATTARLFDEAPAGTGPVDHVMVVGICGGLDPALEVGTVLTPELVVDLASGTTYRHRPPGDTPTSGSVVTTEHVSFDDDLSRRLAADGALGVDMESSAVAEVCEARGCQWSVHRCISDRYVDGLLDPRVVALIDDDGAIDLEALTRLLAEDPGLSPRLERLANDTALATRRAAEDAVRACLTFDRAGDS